MRRVACPLGEIIHPIRCSLEWCRTICLPCISLAVICSVEDDFDQDKLEEMLHRQIYSRHHHHKGANTRICGLCAHTVVAFDAQVLKSVHFGVYHSTRCLRYHLATLGILVRLSACSVLCSALLFDARFGVHCFLGSPYTTYLTSTNFQQDQLL